MRKHMPKIWPYHRLKINIIAQHDQLSTTINILQPHVNKFQIDIITHYGWTTDQYKPIQILKSIQILFPYFEMSWIESLHKNGVQELSSQVKCRSCLNSAGLFEFFDSFDWFCVVWKLFTFKKMPQLWTLMVSLGKKQLGSTSPWIVPRLVPHMKHLHTCLAEIFSFVTNSCKIVGVYFNAKVYLQNNRKSHQLPNYCWYNITLYNTLSLRSPGYDPSEATSCRGAEP